MPWGSKSGRTAPLPSNWPDLRDEQLVKDGHRCTYVSPDTGQRCTARATDVDHVGAADDHTDLTSLCSWHHDRKTGRQGATSKKRTRAARRAPRHPGLRF